MSVVDNESRLIKPLYLCFLPPDAVPTMATIFPMILVDVQSREHALAAEMGDWEAEKVQQSHPLLSRLRLSSPCTVSAPKAFHL